MNRALWATAPPRARHAVACACEHVRLYSVSIIRDATTTGHVVQKVLLTARMQVIRAVPDDIDSVSYNRSLRRRDDDEPDRRDRRESP
jgi:hypothetical protein